MSTRHQCEYQLPRGNYGDAIDGCFEDSRGRLWVGNAEYASQVAYCPFCGYKSPNPPEMNPTNSGMRTDSSDPASIDVVTYD